MVLSSLLKSCQQPPAMFTAQIGAVDSLGKIGAIPRVSPLSASIFAMSKLSKLCSPTRSLETPPKMSKDDMDVDEQAQAASSNAMAALMANAKGKAKEAANGDGVLTEKELRELNVRDGLPWYVDLPLLPGEKRGEILIAIARVEKYRPNTLDEVVSHHDITTTCELYSFQAGDLAHACVVEKFIEAGRLPHLLLYGPPGESFT